MFLHAYPCTSEMYLEVLGPEMADCVIVLLHNRVSHVFSTMFMFVYKDLKNPHREAISGTWGVNQYVWLGVC